MERLCQFIYLPKQEEALQYLTDLVQELTERFHDYRLPIESVLKFVEARERSADADFYVSSRERTADAYGPIRTPNQFEVPKTTTAVEFIDRRLGPWFSSEVR